MKNPCKGCLDRRLGCHGVCRSYQDWKKEYTETQEWLRKQNPDYSPARRKRMDRRIVKDARGWKGMSHKFKTED
jgi:hypothetical protein